jgi:hypothetical protein
MPIRQDCGMVSSPRWLDRYRDGQHDQVWQELRQVGSGIRESEWAEEARLVCDEMARRARHNIELIVERLSNDGYRFHTNDDDQTPVQPHLPPTPAAAAHADWLEQQFGLVPMTLLSWVRIVGDVWLVGTHPQWSTSAAADPLVIEAEGSRYGGGPSIREYIDDEWADWQQRRAGDLATAGLFVLPLAPDRFHKDNTSGGAPYGIVLPDGCGDGLFAWETTMPFVSYLNWVFRDGGFPWPSGTTASGRSGITSSRTCCRCSCPGATQVATRSRPVRWPDRGCDRRPGTAPRRAAGRRAPSVDRALIAKIPLQNSLCGLP